MEMKWNDATYNRPQGDRVIDAPYVFMNMEEYTRQLKEEDAWEKNDRNGITLFKTDNLTTVLTCLHKEASIDNSTINGIFQVQVIDGKVRISTDDGDADLKVGEIIVFHPNVKHSIKALKKSTLLLQTINGKDSKQGVY